MQKHWYVIYTKAKCEKKVGNLLTKKKIKNFYPIPFRQESRFRRRKLVNEPLFPSYVFVHMYENEIHLVKQLNHVINLVYWKGEPATIQSEEIEEMRQFITQHQNIRFERSKVNLNSVVSVIDGSSYAVDGNVVVIKNKFIKVNLPSLGYMMIAELEGDAVMGREGISKQNIPFSYSI